MKEHFPYFESTDPVHYLDNAATTQELQLSIQATLEWVRGGRGNPGRGLHTLASRADRELQKARKKTASFMKTKTEQIVFCGGATPAARALSCFLPIKHIAISVGEHHSNILPWMEKGAQISWVALTPEGEIDLCSLQKALDAGVEAFAFAHVFNVLGGENDIKKIAEMCSKRNVKVIVDGTQAPGRCLVRPDEAGADFYFFSAHKCYGPDGAGVLWGKRSALEEAEPLFPGGGMVLSVDERGYRAREDIPAKHEGGTLPLEGIVGMGAALGWLENQEDWIIEHEKHLAEKTRAMLSDIGAKTMGSRSGPGPIAFSLQGVPSHDTAEIASRHNVAIRAGKHCAEPLHRAFGWPESSRVSFAAYNTEDDLLALREALLEAARIFA